MPDEIELPGVLAALSLATDLANDQPFESALRTTVIATELARLAGGTETQITDAYYAALLRFIGCTSFAAEGAALWGGDDRAFHRAFASVDARRPTELFAAVRSRATSGGFFDRARTVAGILSELPSVLPAVAASSCEIAERLTVRLGMSAGVTEALSHTYERWDGGGKPRGLSGDAISWVARVVQVARMVELLPRTVGVEEAVVLLRRRAGRQLDPTFVDLVMKTPSILEPRESAIVWRTIHALGESAAFRPTTGLDEAASAFADFVDLKSSYTLGHSPGVALLAEGAARRLGMSDADAVELRHAALLHDLGAVGIPNGVWDKPGELSSMDRERVRLHPYYTERILSCSPVLEPLGAIAGAHHERLDGSGYHRNVPSAVIGQKARVLAAADVYRALVERRPHRDALSRGDAATEIDKEVAAGRLDREAAEAVLAEAGYARRASPSELPAGLSEREVEVLRWVAQGRTNKEAAEILAISPRTVQHHLKHIYDKIGVSTRAGAALFAFEHGLLLRE